MNVIVARCWLSVVLRRMNGSGGSAFSGSLLRNDSPGVIVNECWEREEIFIFSLSCSSPLSLTLCLVWQQLCLFSLTSPSCCQPFFPCLPLRAASPHVTASLELLEWGMGAEEGQRKGGREVGKEGGGKEWRTDSLPGSWGGGGILQVASASQSIAHWAT